MGTAFTMPIRESPDLQRRSGSSADEFGIELAAAVLDPAAEPLERARRSHADGRSLWQRKARSRDQLDRPLPAQTDNSDGPGSRFAQCGGGGRNIFSLLPAAGASRIVDWNTPSRPAPQPHLPRVKHALPSDLSDSPLRLVFVTLLLAAIGSTFWRPNRRVAIVRESQAQSPRSRPSSRPTITTPTPM